MTYAAVAFAWIIGFVHLAVGFEDNCRDRRRLRRVHVLG